MTHSAKVKVYIFFYFYMIFQRYLKDKAGDPPYFKEIKQLWERFCSWIQTRDAGACSQNPQYMCASRG